MYEAFPGEVKTFLFRGSMFPNEEVFSSALVHGSKLFPLRKLRGA